MAAAPPVVRGLSRAPTRCPPIDRVVVGVVRYLSRLPAQAWLREAEGLADAAYLEACDYTLPKKVSISTSIHPQGTYSIAVTLSTHHGPLATVKGCSKVVF